MIRKRLVYFSVKLCDIKLNISVDCSVIWAETTDICIKLARCCYVTAPPSYGGKSAAPAPAPGAWEERGGHVTPHMARQGTPACPSPSTAPSSVPLSGPDSDKHQSGSQLEIFLHPNISLWKGIIFTTGFAPKLMSVETVLKLRTCESVWVSVSLHCSIKFNTCSCYHQARQR